MNKVISFLLCALLLFTPAAQQIQGNTYTILIPENPTNIIVYYHTNKILYHTDEEPKHPFNYLEGIGNILLEDNPNSIVVVTYYYNKKLVNLIDNLINEYNIENIIISGWSIGGNNAIYAAAALASENRHIQLLLIDSNNTNEIADKYFNKLKEYNVIVNFTSNVTGQSKYKVLRNAIKSEIPIIYLALNIPPNFNGSNHTYCKDCAILYNLYGFLLGNIDLNENYTLGYYNYIEKEMKFSE